jgi:CDGSH-type Zn-finger protein
MSDERNITVLPGGPYLVSGSVPVTSKTPIVSEHGEPLTWKTLPSNEVQERVVLCRCGGSSSPTFPSRSR